MLVVRGKRVILPEGERAAAPQIRDGVIERIDEYATDDPTGATVFNVPDLVVSPVLVDTHVHINEPGRSEWEGFDTATRSAAAGGVTTLVDMPLHSIPATTSAKALRAKLDAARAQVHVDVGFWGGVVPDNAGELDALVDAGGRGFKCFLVPSGVDECAAVTEADLRLALPTLARRGVPLLVHAEIIADRGLRNADSIADSNPQYAAYLATRPHYLTFCAADIPDGATQFKCAPPIRDASHRGALWDGPASGAIDLIASDHSPAPPALKTPGDFTRVWGGIASLELSLPAVWTRLRASGDPAALADLARWMRAGPAALAGLGERKGRIAEGFDADLVVWDPDVEEVVEPARLQQLHKLTPYAGRSLSGTVLTTFVRGERVWHKHRLTRAYGGRLL